MGQISPAQEADGMVVSRRAKKPCQTGCSSTTFADWTLHGMRPVPRQLPFKHKGIDSFLAKVNATQERPTKYLWSTWYFDSQFMHLKLQLMPRYVVVSDYLRSPAKVQAVDDGRLATWKMRERHRKL